MAEIAVEVKDVSKRFRLAHGKYNSLKERLIHAGQSSHEDFWALKNVSLSVAEGETVGILGRNGSGKSTLLKCICGVLQPTSGEVMVRGKLAGLLELGAGFQQDLTGRENIYLNGSMLGMSKKEVDRVFDDIVAVKEACAGAHQIDPAINVLVKYVGSFDDPAAGKEIAGVLLSLAAVIIAVAGALLPAGWAARARPATALRAE